MKITVGQALLILIEQYPDDMTLQKLYLNGAANDDDLEKIKAYLQNPLLQDMDVTIDYTAISDDPTRRYFETHLAQHTLNQQLSNMSLTEIETLYRNFQNLLSKNYLSQFRIPLDDVLSGKVHTSKFEYQTKIHTLLKQLSNCESATNSVNRIRLLQQLSMSLLKEIQKPLVNNYVESQYQRCIKDIHAAIEGTLNAAQQNGVVSDYSFATLLRDCKLIGQLFNNVFERFSKDPSYENTGREFSQIIASIANERALIMQLSQKIQKIAKDDRNYLQKIEQLVTSHFSYLENNTVQNHLLPALQKIQQRKQSADAPEQVIASIVLDLEKIADNFKKMYILARCGYVSTVVAVMDPKSLPYDVYQSGYFLGEKRGRKVKDSSQSSTRSHNVGLLKSTMPTTPDDIARVNKAFNFMKPSEQSEFVPGATWVEDSFSKLVHPFSNSISGTMLIQARTMLALIEKGKKYSTQACDQYFRIFIANMLLQTGGHSIYEYLEPLNIPQIKQALGYQSSLQTERLFYEDNILAFNKALLETIAYNDSYILRRQLLDEIKLMPVKLKPIDEKHSHDATFGTQELDYPQVHIHSILAKRNAPISRQYTQKQSDDRAVSENQTPKSGLSHEAPKKKRQRKE